MKAGKRKVIKTWVAVHLVFKKHGARRDLHVGGARFGFQSSINVNSLSEGRIYTVNGKNDGKPYLKKKWNKL